MGSEPAGPQRLHPLSLLFSIGGSMGRLLVPGLIVLVFARGDRAEVWIMVLFVPSVVVAVSRYLTLRYEITDDELVVREGILFRQTRNVPLDRIHNVDTEQSPLQRALGVCSVRIETAGGGEAEAELKVLSLESVERLRAGIFRDRGPAAGASSAPDEEPGTRLLFAMPLREVLLYGVLSNRGMVVVGAALGVAWQLDAEEAIEAFARERLPSFEGANPVGGALLLVAAFLVLLRGLSVGWALFNLSNFRVARSGDDLQTSHGLWTRRTATVPRHRIQAVSVRATPLWRLSRRAGLAIETAGGEADEARGLGRSWVVPMAPAATVDRIARELLPAAAEGAEWRPVHARAARRIAARSVVGAAAAAGAAALLARAGALAPAVSAAAALLAVGPAILHGRARARRLGWALGGRALTVRDGVWTRRRDVVRFEKIQAVALVRTPFDRRHRMASLRVDTAGASRARIAVRIPYLGERDALRLARELGRRAGRAEFVW